MQDIDLTSLARPEVQEYIISHVHDDPAAIALRKDTPADPRLIADQIKCRKKTMKKFPFLDGKPFIFDSRALEQSSSEAAARYKASLVSGKSLIDVTGGMGMDCHFMAERFEKAVYVERNENLAGLQKLNREMNGWSGIDIRCGDGLEILTSFPADRFDLLFVDPDRREDGSRHVALKNCVPDVAGNMDLFLSRARQVMIKLSPAFDLSEALRAFKTAKAVHVVSVAGECKEVLVVCGREPAETRVTAVSLAPAGQVLHTFTGSPGNVTVPAADCGKYLYIPDPALVQARLTGTYASSAGFSYLNEKTEILAADELPGSCFGKAYEVIAVIPWQRKKAAAYCKENGIGTAAITVTWNRTTISDVAEILGIKNGAGERMVCCYDRTGKKIIVHVRLS